MNFVWIIALLLEASVDVKANKRKVFTVTRDITIFSWKIDRSAILYKKGAEGCFPRKGDGK